MLEVRVDLLPSNKSAALHPQAAVRIHADSLQPLRLRRLWLKSLRALPTDHALLEEGGRCRLPTETAAEAWLRRRLRGRLIGLVPALCC